MVEAIRFFDKIVLKRVAQSLVKVSVTWVTVHVSGKYGVTVDPVQFTAGVYVFLAWGQHGAVAQWPGLEPWLG